MHHEQQLADRKNRGHYRRKRRVGTGAGTTPYPPVGCHVIATGRSPERLEAARAAIGETPDGSYTCRAFDVTDRAAWADFSADLAKRGVSVDVLINNAGFMLPFTRLEKLCDGDIDRILETNLRAGERT